MLFIDNSGICKHFYHADNRLWNVDWYINGGNEYCLLFYDGNF